MSKPKSDTSLQIPDHILRQLLTVSEIRMIKNRWQIISLLGANLSIRAIAEKIKVGTDTVVRVKRFAESKNLKKQISEEENPQKTSTPWIFGKAD